MATVVTVMTDTQIRQILEQALFEWEQGLISRGEFESTIREVIYFMGGERPANTIVVQSHCAPDAKLTATTDTAIAELQEELESWAGMKVPAELLNTIVSKYSLWSDLLQFTAADTVVRERAMSAVSKHVCGKPWPIGGDSKATKDAWHKSFGDNVRRFGIEWGP